MNVMKTAALVSLAIFVVAISNSLTVYATSLSTFSDPTMGIKFVHPSDWITEDGLVHFTTDFDPVYSELYNINYLDPDPESHLIKPVNDFDVTKSKIRDSITLEEAVKNQFSGQTELVNSGSLRLLDGRPAFEIEEHREDGVVVKYVLMVNDGYTYFLDGRTTDDISTINAMIDSFQIINNEQ